MIIEQNEISQICNIHIARIDYFYLYLHFSACLWTQFRQRQDDDFFIQISNPQASINSAFKIKQLTLKHRLSEWVHFSKNNKIDCVSRKNEYDTSASMRLINVFRINSWGGDLSWFFHHIAKLALQYKGAYTSVKWKTNFTLIKLSIIHLIRQ